MRGGASVTFFLPYYTAAIALLYFELRGSRRSAFDMPRLPPWLCIGGLITTYGIQLATIRYQRFLFREKHGALIYRSALRVTMRSIPGRFLP